MHTDRGAIATVGLARVAGKVNYASVLGSAVGRVRAIGELKEGEMPTQDLRAGPTWTSLREAVLVVLHVPNLRRTGSAALVVGSLLFAINQLDVVLRGEADTLVWIKTALTYLVPFGVSNYGVLISTHRNP